MGPNAALLRSLFCLNLIFKVNCKGIIRALLDLTKVHFGLSTLIIPKNLEPYCRDPEPYPTLTPSLYTLIMALTPLL